MKPAFIRSPKDFVCGLLILAIVGVFAVGLLDLQIGSAFRMGPGYFPLVLMIALAGAGVAILLQGVRVEGEAIGELPWRAIALIVLPVVFFALTLRGLGFVPSLGITVFTSTLASRQWDLRVALSTTVALVIGCAAVFIYGLGLPISLFGPWVGGY